MRKLAHHGKDCKRCYKDKSESQKIGPFAVQANDGPQLAAPKSKYIEPILSATSGGEAGVGEVFRTLQLRLRDSTWTIVFKALIVVHLMIREGRPDVTLKYLAQSPKSLAISHFAEGMCAPYRLQRSPRRRPKVCSSEFNRV